MSGPPVSGRDSIDVVVFNFVDDRLYMMTVAYERSRTSGLTEADMITSLTPLYGEPTPPAANARARVDDVNGVVTLAEWQEGDARIALQHSRYNQVFSLVLTSVSLNGLARKAQATAVVLDAREAPARDAALAKKRADEERLAQEKTRATKRAARSSCLSSRAGARRARTPTARGLPPTMAGAGCGIDCSRRQLQRRRWPRCRHAGRRCDTAGGDPRTCRQPRPPSYHCVGRRRSRRSQWIHRLGERDEVGDARSNGRGDRRVPPARLAGAALGLAHPCRMKEPVTGFTVQTVSPAATLRQSPRLPIGVRARPGHCPTSSDRADRTSTGARRDQW
jgi:hypothetical protein